MAVYLNDLVKNSVNRKYFFDLILDHLPYKGEFGSKSVTNVTTNGDETEATFSNDALKQIVRLRPGTIFIYIEFLQGEKKGTIIHVEEHCGLDFSEGIPVDEKKDNIRDAFVQITNNGATYGYVYDNLFDNEPTSLHSCFFKDHTGSGNLTLRERAELSEQRIEFPFGDSTFAPDINKFIGMLIDCNPEELFMQLNVGKRL